MAIIARAAISGAAKVFGGWLSKKSSAKAAKIAHKRNVSDYKHRYQWTMADMRKAGLNPILAAGTGAGSLPGNTAAEAGQIGEGVAQAPASALSAMQAKATIQATQAQAAKTTQDAKAQTIDNVYRDRQANAATAIAEYDAHIKGFDYGSAHSASVADKAKYKDGRRLTLKDRATDISNSAKMQYTTESEAREALIRAGLPAATFEGKGGKYLVEAVKILMEKGIRR